MTKALESVPTRYAELLQMLTYKRPSGSKAEAAFVARYITPLGAAPDEYGNQWFTIGKDSPILWSSHTDTVHSEGGPQRILYGAGIASTAEDSSDCLGADCTVGVWLMCEMVRAGIPGTYVWHCEEEVGGHGSDYIAKHTPERLDGIQFAIAFDRKGFNEVITHQGCSRCASDVFAESLVNVLHPMAYELSDGGTFTDTANYSGIVPECTNISVGYRGQHTSGETLDVFFAGRLLDRILSADWSRLTCSRDPAEIEYDDWPLPYGGTASPSLDSFARLIAENPEEVAEFLERIGYGEKDLDDFIWGTSSVGESRLV